MTSTIPRRGRPVAGPACAQRTQLERPVRQPGQIHEAFQSSALQSERSIEPQDGVVLQTEGGAEDSSLARRELTKRDGRLRAQARGGTLLLL